MSANEQVDDQSAFDDCVTHSSVMDTVNAAIECDEKLLVTYFIRWMQDKNDIQLPEHVHVAFEWMCVESLDCLTCECMRSLVNACFTAVVRVFVADKDKEIEQLVEKMDRGNYFRLMQAALANCSVFTDEQLMSIFQMGKEHVFLVASCFPRAVHFAKVDYIAFVKSLFTPPKYNRYWASRHGHMFMDVYTTRSRNAAHLPERFGLAFAAAYWFTAEHNMVSALQELFLSGAYDKVRAVVDANEFDWWQPYLDRELSLAEHCLQMLDAPYEPDKQVEVITQDNYCSKCIFFIGSFVEKRQSKCADGESTACNIDERDQLNSNQQDSVEYCMHGIPTKPIKKFVVISEEHHRANCVRAVDEYLRMHERIFCKQKFHQSSMCTRRRWMHFLVNYTDSWNLQYVLKGESVANDVVCGMRDCLQKTKQSILEYNSLA